MNESSDPAKEPADETELDARATKSSDTDLVGADEPSDENPSGEVKTRADQGPGWLPAIMAGTVLMGILGFVFCAFSTWILFQKRTELAIRTLKGAYVSELEQSLLEPETKQRVVEEVKTLIAAMEGGKYEDWQSAAIMQRLQRLPVAQWGELQAVRAFIVKSDRDNQSDQIKELSRLERAVEKGKATSFDFQDVLDPVRRPDPGSSTGFELIRPLVTESVDEVVLRAKLVADRADVPDQAFPDVDLAVIVRKQVEEGASTGGY